MVSWYPHVESGGGCAGRRAAPGLSAVEHPLSRPPRSPLASAQGHADPPEAQQHPHVVQADAPYDWEATMTDRIGEHIVTLARNTDMLTRLECVVQPALYAANQDIDRALDRTDTDAAVSALRRLVSLGVIAQDTLERLS